MISGENVLDYEQFKRVRNLCGEKSLPYLTPKTFAKLQVSILPTISSNKKVRLF